MKARSSVNPLLLALQLVEKDIVLNFHMLVSLERVDKQKIRTVGILAHTHNHTHFLAIERVQSESSFQTISLSNTVALTDRHRQIRRAMATVKCESR